MSEENITPDVADLETPDIPMPEHQEKTGIKDEIDGAFKFAFIGAGQGGGRLAEQFYKIGYRRVCAINTASQDLATLKLPDQNKFLIGEGGAGKNPAAAAALFHDKREDVLDLMRRCFSEPFDRIMITVGAGGGTGAGTVVPLVETASELQIALKCPTDKVGVIVALPKNSEGKKPNANAYFVLDVLLELVNAGRVAPLVILDNERIQAVHPGLPVNTFWDTANASVCSLFHLFNNICTKNSSFTSFDANDFKTILDSGLIVFGATPVKKWSDPTDISFALRDNLKRNILSGGINLSSGSVAGAVIIGGKSVLNEVAQDSLDRAFDQLNRLLRPGSTVHRGIYSGSKDSLAVYTAIGGLAKPEEKLAELQKLGDVLIGHKPDIGPVLGEHR